MSFRLVSQSTVSSSLVIYHFISSAPSWNERTHPNLVLQASQAREIEIFVDCKLAASFSCLFVTPCLLSFVASFVVFDFLGVSLKLTGF